MNKTNKSGYTGVRHREDCSIRDWEAYIHVFGNKVNKSTSTCQQAVLVRQTMEKTVQRLKAAGLIHNPNTHKVVPL
ncbi:TPA: hypothetical protein N3288_000215 [Klebsiella aerogenes]|nr:hypothetical protein [Klebsiella aerogenes]